VEELTQRTHDFFERELEKMAAEIA